MLELRDNVKADIGEFVLEHLQESDVAEAEANFFAKYAIAPPVLVNLIRPNDYMDIAEAFKLSNEGAMYSWNYYCRWLRIFDFKDYELKLKSMFTIGKDEGDGLTKATPVLRMGKGA